MILDLIFAALLVIAGWECLMYALQRRRIIATREARKKVNEALQRLERIGRVVT